MPAAASAGGDASARQSLTIDDYTPPKVLQAGNDSNAYPDIERNLGSEAWVLVNMMVDSEGNPYEVSVVDSMSNPAFDSAAIKVVSGYKFEPARVNGTPVDSVVNMPVKFMIKDHQAGASIEFLHDYRRVTKAIESADESAASTALESLKPKTLYEGAYYSLANYFFLQKWGDRGQQLQALQRALRFGSEKGFLTKDTYYKALASKFSLELQQMDFAEALSTYRALSKEQQQDPRIKDAATEVELLRNDQRKFSVAGIIPERHTWCYWLLKRGFSIEVTEGKAHEIKLRCRAKYVAMPYRQGVKITIPKSYGDCNLELTGDPDSKFVLTQSPPSQ
jgi:protein TonB